MPSMPKRSARRIVAVLGAWTAIAILAGVGLESSILRLLVSDEGTRRELAGWIVSGLWFLGLWFITTHRPLNGWIDRADD
jgi:hypothetical protein